jgi:flagellin
MALTVNTNVSSLNAQRNLNTSQVSLTTAMQRLSSGMRVNSAKDDAAGLAISQRFTAQIRGNDQASRNTNDAISLSQTAEGDLDQIGNNLQRVRELAVQASNASNSASDRASINNEATQLINEIDRVASNSSFNGTKLLDGSFSAKDFQVGANGTDNDRVTIASIASARTNALGQSAVQNALIATTSTALGADNLILNGVNVGASSADGVSSAEATSSGIAKAAAINAVSGTSGVTATVDATSKAFTATGVGGATTGASINGVLLGTAGAVTLSANASSAAAEMATAINAVSNQTGVTATYSGTGYTLAAADGRNITVAATAAGDSGLIVATTHSSINLSSSFSSGITIGGTQAADIGASNGNTAASGALSSLDLSTALGSQAALTTLDSAINTTRGALGAYQNRFETTIASLQTTTENLTASRGRIKDADFAKETASLSRAQVLQQAGTAMLAQANQSAQGVLSLLR